MTPEERFWSYVLKIEDEDSCWPWLGAKHQGYGGFWLNGKTIGAHQFSLSLKLGRWPELCSCHTCDNGLCVRPDHLFEGSVSENALDAVAKGRWAPQNGAFNPVAKLSWEQVGSLRSEYGILTPRGRGRKRGQPTMASLAVKYGISIGQVHAAVHRLTYRKVVLPNGLEDISSS